MSKENVWNTYDQEALTQLEKTCAAYKAFLDEGKTERECVKATVRAAKEAGYEDLDEVLASGKTLTTGDKVYAVNKGKGIALFQIGRRPMMEGMRILGAHIDSPRIDLKQVPLYEDTELAYLDTHYYGGIKKYQWVTIPLAMHGVVAKKDGSVVEITIGEQDDDPVLVISDLLIHLSAEQLEKKARVVIEGEGLDVLIGSQPMKSEGDEEKQKDAVKTAMLKIFADRYGIEEDDFLSAELEIVPAGRARDCGLDRSMIMAYGQDDRVCAYTSLEAMLETDVQEYTGCCLLVDKEEIGSVGATGMESRFFENTVAYLLSACGQMDGAGLNLRRALANAKMLSSDVSAAYDPLYGAAFEKKNAAYFGKGLVFNKYTGARGKSGSNDASAEYVAWVRNVMDSEGVAFQTAELGKVDFGGGGTIAYITAAYGMDVIDSGVAVLSMHAPMEITSKADVYEAKKGYVAFLKA